MLDEIEDYTKERGESGDMIVYVTRCKNFDIEPQPDVANSDRWLANTLYRSKHKHLTVKSAERSTYYKVVECYFMLIKIVGIDTKKWGELYLKEN